MADRFYVDAGRLDRRVQFQRKTITRDAYGAEVATWSTVVTAWAEVRDILLWNNGETSAENMRQLTRPARIFMRYRTDITTDMRLVVGTRTMQIVSIAELGQKQAIELMCEAYSTDGGT